MEDDDPIDVVISALVFLCDDRDDGMLQADSAGCLGWTVWPSSQLDHKLISAKAVDVCIRINLPQLFANVLENPISGCTACVIQIGLEVLDVKASVIASVELLPALSCCTTDILKELSLRFATRKEIFLNAPFP